ncbi:MAG: hypothetical protein ACREJ2_05720 [Planctomycetota bacterium]
MGGNPYWYFVKYQDDLGDALQQLRDREFRAGRYFPAIDAMFEFPFPPGPDSPAPGAQHLSIEEAIEAAAESGTNSILDIESIGDEPFFCVAAPVDPALLRQLVGTDQPTRAMLESPAANELFESIERGQALYVVLYKDGQPDEIYFAGISFD